MVVDVLEQMVPFAQAWELISMFHPGWIKGGGSSRYWLTRHGDLQLIKYLAEVMFSSLLKLLENIFSANLSYDFLVWK